MLAVVLVNCFLFVVCGLMFVARCYYLLVVCVLFVVLRCRLFVVR